MKVEAKYYIFFITYIHFTKFPSYIDYKRPTSNKFQMGFSFLGYSFAPSDGCPKYNKFSYLLLKQSETFSNAARKSPNFFSWQ